MSSTPYSADLAAEPLLRRIVLSSGFALLLAFNQVVIKVTNGGFQPVFFAGLRSAGAVVCIWLWLRWRGIPWLTMPG